MWKVSPSQLVHFFIRLKQVRISSSYLCICSQTYAFKAKWLKLEGFWTLTLSYKKRWMPLKVLLDFRKAFSTGVNLKPQAGTKDCINIKGKKPWSISPLLSLRFHNNLINYYYLLIPETGLMLAVDSDSCSQRDVSGKVEARYLSSLYLQVTANSWIGCASVVQTLVYKPGQ